MDEIRSILPLVYDQLSPTPQLCWPLLCRRVGATVWVKHENHQLTGAFKVRGGIVYLHRLINSRPGLAGVITATRGNHGQSIAFAAKRHGLDCVIVVPHGNSVEKNLAMQAWGGELIEQGRDFNAAADHAAKIARDRNLHFVPSYHRDLICGVATYWLELFETTKDLDAVYVPIGLGSGVSAAIAVRDGLGLKTRIIGVVSQHAPAYALSVEAGRCVEHAPTTKIADGIAVRRPDTTALEVIRNGVDRIVSVSDDEIAQAMKAYFVDTHNVAEGAGAASLAALIKERKQTQGQTVGVVLCGGNVDHDVFGEILGTQDL
ncbi:MAG: threonine dehydratase [Planctomycetota bacterium]